MTRTRKADLLTALGARLAGQRLCWEGAVWELLETLDEDPVPTVVLRAVDGARGIQPNQHGEAVRRAPALLELPLLDEAGELHPELAALLEANAIPPP